MLSLEYNVVMNYVCSDFIDSVGFFHVFQRMIRNALFIYHDHVFDFLVEFIDQKAIGMDNIFSGFRLIQQWDDIIKIQRRYGK